MNEQNLEKTSADLSHAERFGTAAVRETGQNAIEQWKQDWEMLAAYLHYSWKNGKKPA